MGFQLCWVRLRLEAIIGSALGVYGGWSLSAGLHDFRVSRLPFRAFSPKRLFHERPSVWGAGLLHVRAVINNFLGGGGRVM